MANRLISFSACWRFCFWLRALHSRRTSNNIRLGYGLYNRQARSHTAVKGLKNELLATGKTNKSMLPLFTFSVESDLTGQPGC